MLFCLTGKTLRPKTVTTTSRRRAAQRLGRSGLKQKPSQAAVTLADFFKVKAKADPLHSGGLSAPGKADDRPAGRSSSGPGGTTSRHEKTATSLILFEEVKRQHRHSDTHESDSTLISTSLVFILVKVAANGSLSKDCRWTENSRLSPLFAAFHSFLHSLTL